MKKGLLTLLLTCFALTIQAQHFKHELRWSIGFGDEPQLNCLSLKTTLLCSRHPVTLTVH